MTIDVIAIGFHPPEGVNVIIEVPNSVEPIKNEENWNNVRSWVHHALRLLEQVDEALIAERGENQRFSAS